MEEGEIKRKRKAFTVLGLVTTDAEKGTKGRKKEKRQLANAKRIVQPRQSRPLGKFPQRGGVTWKRKKNDRVRKKLVSDKGEICGLCRFGKKGEEGRAIKKSKAKERVKGIKEKQDLGRETKDDC